MIGWSEVLVILLVVLIIFGAGRFPVIMENFAKGIKTFKKTMREEEGRKTEPKRARKKGPRAGARPRK